MFDGCQLCTWFLCNDVSHQIWCNCGRSSRWSYGPYPLRSTLLQNDSRFRNLHDYSGQIVDATTQFWGSPGKPGTASLDHLQVLGSALREHLYVFVHGHRILCEAELWNSPDIKIIKCFRSVQSGAVNFYSHYPSLAPLISASLAPHHS